MYVRSISMHAVSYFKEGDMVLILLNKCLAWPYSKKAILAWTECSDMKHWLTKYAQLFESFAGVQWLLILLVFYKHMLLIRWVLLQEGVSKAKYHIHHSHSVFHLCWSLYPLFSYCIIPCRLETIFSML